MYTYGSFPRLFKSAWRSRLSQLPVEVLTGKILVRWGTWRTDLAAWSGVSGLTKTSVESGSNKTWLTSSVVLTQQRTCWIRTTFRHIETARIQHWHIRPTVSCIRLHVNDLWHSYKGGTHQIRNDFQRAAGFYSCTFLYYIKHIIGKKNKNNAITQSLESVSTVVWGEKSEKSF